MNKNPRTGSEMAPFKVHCSIAIRLVLSTVLGTHFNDGEVRYFLSIDRYVGFDGSVADALRIAACTQHISEFIWKTFLGFFSRPYPCGVAQNLCSLAQHATTSRAEIDLRDFDLRVLFSAVRTPTPEVCVISDAVCLVCLMVNANSRMCLVRGPTRMT